jgi:16S rRNA (adenine1518-N6/adenine1519-N6)-dimethyltransferase
VESAVVMLRPRPETDVNQLCDGAAFRRLVKRGFARRRKQLHKNLGDEIEDWTALCAALEVPETVRAEELSLEQWIALTRFVTGADRVTPQDVHGEIFDVVNEADEVIGQASRHDVHAQGLRHRAVHVLVFNKEGELFLQRRSPWKDMHPSCWDSSAAGHVDAGQDYDPTAERELREELGVSAAVTPIGQVAACAETGWEFVGLYRAEHQGPFQLHPAEIDCGAWFSREQIDHWIAARPQDFATGFLECYRVFSQVGGTGAQTL